MEDPRVRSADSIVGRVSELDALGAFLDDHSSAATLVLAGAAGIGKTTLWQYGVDRAATLGLRVLSTRASQGEAELLFASLADLLDGVEPAALDAVPGPQRQALDVAFRHVPPGPEPPDPYAISAGFVAAVRAVSTTPGPLVAIDDVQWLDPSSAGCLAFLARRQAGQGGQRIRWLLSRRGDQPSDLERALEPHGIEPVRVDRMSLGAIGRLISDRLDIAMPRRVLRQLYETSQGNPLFALEVARAIRDAGVPPPGVELPLPSRIDDAVGARVRRLPAGQKRVLLAVSMSGTLSRDDLAAITNPLAVEDAVDGGIVWFDRDRVRPAHPMLAAAARKQSSAAQRRDVHLRLGQTINDPVLRARHQALASPRADPTVAATAADAARAALLQGAVQEAQDLAAHAVRLTPREDPAEGERLLDLVRCHLAGGDAPAAISVLEGGSDKLHPGRPRIEAQLLRARAEQCTSAILRELDGVIAAAEHEPDLLAIALSEKAITLSIGLVERIQEAAELAHRAEVAGHGTEQETRFRIPAAWVRVLTGTSLESFRQHAGSQQVGNDRYLTHIDRAIAVQLAFRGDLEGARQVVARLIDGADERGDIGAFVGRLQLCEFALRAGDIAEARHLIDELQQWAALSKVRIVYARMNALVGAITGDPAAADRAAQVVLEQDPDAVTGWDRLETIRALGIAALVVRDYQTAVRHLDAVWQQCERAGVRDPGAFPVAGDLVEALVGVGSLEAAAHVAARLEYLAIDQQHPWGLATVLRARALIAAAAGDPSTDPQDDLAAAAAQYARLGLDFERARCLTLLGGIHRRAKKRALARAVLDEAVETLDHLGCEGWAVQAREERSRVSGRRASGGAADLTESEQRVAELAAGGLSNKEIASALFVSVPTVETHLTHVYAKLRVRSRSQLAARITPG